MSNSGRPAEFPNKKLIGFNDEQIAAVNEWRRAQPDPIPNFSEAIRRLVEKALSDQ
jgi:hypothetical protein